MTPATGQAPGQLTIEVNAEGLSPGTYPATVTVAERGASTPTLSIPVELVVAPASAGEGATPRSP